MAAFGDKIIRGTLILACLKLYYVIKLISLQIGNKKHRFITYDRDIKNHNRLKITDQHRSLSKILYDRNGLEAAGRERLISGKEESVVLAETNSQNAAIAEVRAKSLLQPYVICSYYHCTYRQAPDSDN